IPSLRSGSRGARLLPRSTSGDSSRRELFIYSGNQVLFTGVSQGLRERWFCRGFSPGDSRSFVAKTCFFSDPEAKRSPRFSSSGGYVRTDMTPATRSFPTHSQRVRDAVDVVEPGRDQGDLQNPPVVEADRTEAVMIGASHFGGVARQERDVIEHDPIAFIDRS